MPARAADRSGHEHIEARDVGGRRPLRRQPRVPRPGRACPERDPRAKTSRLHRHAWRQRHGQRSGVIVPTPTRATASSNAFLRAACEPMPAPKVPASKPACRCRCSTSRRMALMGLDLKTDPPVWTFNGEPAPVSRTRGASGCCHRGRFRRKTLPPVPATTAGGTAIDAATARSSAGFDTPDTPVAQPDRLPDGRTVSWGRCRARKTARPVSPSMCKIARSCAT
jgi:hypothetical protein